MRRLLRRADYKQFTLQEVKNFIKDNNIYFDPPLEDDELKDVVDDLNDTADYEYFSGAGRELDEDNIYSKLEQWFGDRL
jgi:hypothetical protein